jgi:hypothetical protein
MSLRNKQMTPTFPFCSVSRNLRVVVFINFHAGVRLKWNTRYPTKLLGNSIRNELGTARPSDVFATTATARRRASRFGKATAKGKNSV